MVTYDTASGEGRLYLDGRLLWIEPLGSFVPDTRGELLIGSSDRRTAFFKGSFDEVSLYNRALRPDEISTLYRSGNRGKVPVDSNTAPTVIAGPNKYVDVGAPVALSGRVSDDGLPGSVPVAITWRVISGPSGAVFANEHAAVTTATFSSDGIYVLQLSADDGAMSTTDRCEVRVGSARSAPAPTGLVASWPLNGDYRDAVRGLELRPVGRSLFATGQSGLASTFDGAVDYLYLDPNTPAGVQGLDQISIEFWLRPSAPVSPCNLLRWRTSTTVGAGVGIDPDGSSLNVNLMEVGGVVHFFQATNCLRADQWNHVLIDYSRTSGAAHVYANGSLVAQQNLGGYVLDLRGTMIVGSTDGRASMYRGAIDDLTFYNRILPASEVSTLFTAGSAGRIINRPPQVQIAGRNDIYLSDGLHLSAHAADDGLPAPSHLSYHWSFVSATSTYGSAEFSPSADAAEVDVSFSIDAQYVLQLVVSDGDKTMTVPWVVRVREGVPPPVSITIVQPVAGALLPANTGFQISAHTEGVVAKVEFFRDAIKLGEQTMTAADDPHRYFWTVNGGLPIGTYVLTAVASDVNGVPVASEPVNVSVGADPGPPIADIAAPIDSARIAAPAPITGVAATPLLSMWTAQYRLKAPEGGASNEWTTFAHGTNQVGTAATTTAPEVPGTLGTFDPTLLLNGIYEIQLTVTDTVGRAATAGPIPVIVEGNMKIGAFSLAFEDLKVPVAGIPITITRTYDSRDVRVGDFGPGWRIAVANVRVQKNRDLGKGWWQTPVAPGDPQFQFFTVEPQTDRIVTVVMPDGETHRFKAGAYVKWREGDPDNASFGRVVRQGLYKFYPVGDTTSKLEPLDTSNQLWDQFWIAGTDTQDLYAGQYGDIDFIPYNTSRFRLTTKDGTVYIVDEALGLLEMRDLNGNTLVVNRDAQNRVTSVVFTLNGQPSALSSSVTIHRDATGAVDYIRDPAGNDVDYLYDAKGRLSSFTNRTLNVTQFKYLNANYPYYLTDIVDPRGVTALRTEYDATTGKMIKQIDADGRETVFSHGAGTDPASRVEKVKDRLGNETAFYYDDRGNITTKVDALGAQTSFSYYADSDRVKFETDHYGNVKSMAYDDRGNTVVETVGASVAEDPANPSTGHTPRTAYNATSAPTQITDADGRSQTFGYDPATNNLLTQTVGAGGASPATTTFAYNTDGTLKTTTDARGNITGYAYDYGFSAPAYPGAVKKVTVTVSAPDGTVLRATRTLYDAQENQLAQIVSRHLPDGTAEDIVTRYVYDTENRLVATIMPDGRVSETRFTSFGKSDKAVLWQSLADYQARDDTKARITSYGYDARGNETSIAYPDGTTEQMAFDAENRKIWSQDRRGSRTFFVYDAAGRLTSTIYPDADDASGTGVLPVDATDPRLANNPRTTTVYDLVGRVTDSFDEAGSHTKTVYYDDGSPDAGRRKQTVQVRAAGNLTTTSQYDGAGNVRFVTDPRGNTVETVYDDQSRLRYTKYPATDENPATQTETQYDALGRRAVVIDQEGKTTRYRYDGLGRLIEVRQYLDQLLAAGDGDFHLLATHPSLLATTYSYDESGSQQTQTDALGRTTTFWTDNVGRRTKRVLPKDATEATALSEALQYDAWGNLWKRTDFAGKTTTFGYDALNRLTSKTADPTHPSLGYTNAIARIEYDYDENGARKAARTYNGANTLLCSETTPHDERGRTTYKDTAGGRLTYGYYANNHLKATDSSNANGIHLAYRYDELNRLEHLDDTTTGATLTTDYTYNANGSLETVTAPNGIQHAYQYDTLNRLRTLSVKVGTIVPNGPPLGTVVHAYEYKLNPSGHRRQVLEAGKTTTYSYDELYRLTGEAISGASDPGQNGAIGYELDKVGNRKSRTSQLSTLNAQLGLTYNARDWLSTDTYDANGNTLTSSELSSLNSQLSGTDTYDFENRLIVRTKSDGSTINVVYDADGIRIGKNIADITGTLTTSTSWLVDTNNLTGYAQVVEEQVSGISPTAYSLKRTYTYGTSLISRVEQLQTPNSELQTVTTRYYASDGHGNVRELTDETGAVTNRYTYDAFGNLITKSGSTTNAYLYCGEQYDPDLGLYYLRARYLNPDSGRFWSMDTYQGSTEDTTSLHKYLYAGGNPNAFRDPTGRFRIDEVSATVFVVGVLQSIAVVTWASLSTGAVAVGPAVTTQIKLKQLQDKYLNFKCWEFADEAKEYLEKKGMKYGDDFTIIEYESRRYQTRGDTVGAVDGFGRYGGQVISWNRNHRGIILSNNFRRWSFLTGTVSDNNVIGVPLMGWVTGYFVVPVDAVRAGSNEVLIAAAAGMGIGDIRFLKDNGKFGFAD